MVRKLFVQFFCALLLVSCNYFESKWNSEPIREIDTVVDFNVVDAFPLFPNCKDIPSRDKQQICFQLEIAQHINASLKKYTLNSNEFINDTILVKLKIDILGKTSLSSIEISEITKNQFPEFDSILKLSLQNLPILQPAIKRNMPVATEFTLPIVVKN
ncbi:MAG: hypothetical protein HKP59_11905 [Lutibacter sp.]|uniref:hypothetical protein n=1 Tax=Lutibacter sp. TaxID=1925666 RepID=UPI0017EDEFB9|nr:hypothetical protein [Lutibacter sp.]MBT8318318.1 hypothetical protein [Lutibacter sp.]NNJ59176.1 hypothetical protein [Lutibacter sp.]